MKRATAIAAILFLVALSLLPAQAAVSVYANETAALSNDTATTAESRIATNDLSTSNSVAETKTGHKRKRPSNADHSSIRIDEDGIHVGGEDPVDISVPGFGLSKGGGRVAILLGAAAIGWVLAVLWLPWGNLPSLDLSVLRSLDPQVLTPWILVLTVIASLIWAVVSAVQWDD